MLNDVIHAYIIRYVCIIYMIFDSSSFSWTYWWYFFSTSRTWKTYTYTYMALSHQHFFSHSKSFYWLGVTVAFNWKWVVMKSHGPQVLLFKVNKKLYLYVSIQSSASTCEKCRWKLNSLWHMFDFEQNCGKHRNSNELASFLEFLGGQTQHVHKKHTNHVRNIPNLQRHPTKKKQHQHHINLQFKEKPLSILTILRRPCQSWPLPVASPGSCIFWGFQFFIAQKNIQKSKKSNGLNVTNVTKGRQPPRHQRRGSREWFLHFGVDP